MMMLKPIFSKLNLLECDIDNEYYLSVADLLEDETVLIMKDFIQHGNTTCYQHCVNVSYYNYRVCKMLRLDARCAARAGLLHDLFLYDWHNHKRSKGERLHGFSHPAIALSNATQYFELNDMEKDIIAKHMFPLTLRAVPKYKETVVITFVDKYCGLMETVQSRLIATAKFAIAIKHYVIKNRNNNY